MKPAARTAAQFFTGFAGYPLLELIWRGRTHWSMALTGGTCLVALCRLFERQARRPLWVRCAHGSLVVTAIEFLVGCIVNRKLKLGVWDYSKRRFNLLGQVCLRYSLLWGLLCLPVCLLCDKRRRRDD